MNVENVKFFSLFFCIMLAFGFVSADFSAQAHESSPAIVPEWSTAGIPVDYTVTICNLLGEGGDSIDEVRLYQSAGYTILNADEKDDWFKSAWNPIKEFYQYTANEAAYYIDENECTDFTFTAQTPDEEACSVEWKFETRDLNNVWKEIFDTTSVDKLEPLLIKTVTGAQMLNGGDAPCLNGPADGEECWIRQDTQITVFVEDQGACDPSSGLDWCEISYILDDGNSYPLEYEDLDGKQTWERTISFPEDSKHALNVTCVDRAGNLLEDIEVFRVDDTNPVTTKIYGEPRFAPAGEMNDGVAYPHYIDTTTPVSLSAVDPEHAPDFLGDCSIDNVVTYYHEERVDDSWCENEDACAPICVPFWDIGYFSTQTYQDDGCVWQTYDEFAPFSINEESCHVIQFYSVDGIGNVEDMNYQCVFVEDGAPEVNKDNGDAILDYGESNFTNDGNQKGEFHWINTSMPVTFTCDDSWNGEADHPSGQEEVCFKVSYDYPQWGYITDEYCYDTLENEYCCVDATPEVPFEFYFQEESMHNLEYYCVDALGHESDEHVQYYKVDDTAPITTKTYNPDAYVDSNGWEYIDTIHDISLSAIDGGAICAVGVDEMQYRVSGSLADDFCQSCDSWMNRIRPMMGDWITYGVPFKINEESCHVIEYRSIDLLTNTEDIQWQCVFSDKTRPETTFSVLYAQYPDPITESSEYPRWIDTVSRINLEATDLGPHPSGVDEIYYRVTEVEDEYCESVHSGCSEADGDDVLGGWKTYSTPFGIEESCHLIEYYAVDNVGKIEDVEKQCVYSDHTKPVTEQSYSPESYVDSSNGWEYIDTVHSIVLTAKDPLPHPAGIAETQYRVSGALADKFCEPVNCDDWMTALRPDMGAWSTYQEPFKIDEESCHVFEYRSIDKVGKIEDIQWECVFVDKTYPEIKKTYIGPQSPNPIESDTPYPHYINSETLVEIDATDVGPHPAGMASVEYNVKLMAGNEACENELRCEEAKFEHGWTDYTNPFVIPEDSCHVIDIKAVDNVGKTSYHRQCVFVDNQAPEIEKIITGTQMEAEEPIHMYLTNESVISLECSDVEPHPVGDEVISWEMYWKYDNCEEDAGWTLIDSGDADGSVEFTGLDDSCHKFVYSCKDGLGNTGATEIEFDIVDNQAPDPIKIVGEPRDVWDGVGSLFYETFELDGETVNLVDFCLVEGNCWKVTLDTPISMSCEDPAPHPVGNERVCFNVELDGDDWTGGELGYCNEYDGDYNESGDGYCCFDKSVGEDFRFLEFSEHNLKFYCEDALGNKGPIDDEKFKVDGEGFEIQLNKKWNLISFPVVLLNDDPDEVFKNVDVDQCIQSVWAYDGVDEEWTVWTPGNAPDNLRVEPGYGYWVVANEDCMLTIGGSLLSPGRSPPSRELASGWNLVGYYGMKDINGVNLDGYYGPAENGRDAYCAFYSLTGGFFDNPQWSEVSGYWELYNPDTFESYSPGESLDAGAGYWIFMKDGSDVYSPSSVCWDKNEMLGGILA